MQVYSVNVSTKYVKTICNNEYKYACPDKCPLVQCRSCSFSTSFNMSTVLSGRVFSGVSLNPHTRTAENGSFVWWYLLSGCQGRTWCGKPSFAVMEEFNKEQSNADPSIRGVQLQCTTSTASPGNSPNPKRTSAHCKQSL